MKRKIYISSTFRDLQLFRKELMETLIFLQDYFTLVCPMEYMLPGSTDTILEQCLGYVSDCDIYVLILGKYYGSLPPGEAVSYTHLEYRRAKENEKIIIPLVADEQQEYLRNLTSDNEKALNDFKDEVRKTKLTLKDFTNPDHLSKQLLLSLYKLSDNKWALRESEDVRYFCDRENQYLDFVGEKKKGKLNVVAIPCTIHDQAEYFNRRMARAEFGLQKEYIEIPMGAGTIIGTSTNYEKHKRRFITSIFQNFLEVGEDFPTTLEECFTYFKENKVSNIYIEFKLARQDTENQVVINSLINFLNELYAACKEAVVTLFFAVIFEYENTETPTEGIVNCISEKADFEIIELEVLPVITGKNVKIWMADYVTSMDANQIDALLTPYLNGTASYKMYELFPILGKLINETTNHD